MDGDENLHAICASQITESEFKMRIYFQNLPFHVSIIQLRTNYYLLLLSVGVSSVIDMSIPLRSMIMIMIMMMMMIRSD